MSPFLIAEEMCLKENVQDILGVLEDFPDDIHEGGVVLTIDSVGMLVNGFELLHRRICSRMADDELVRTGELVASIFCNAYCMFEGKTNVIGLCVRYVVFKMIYGAILQMFSQLVELGDIKVGESDRINIEQLKTITSGVTDGHIQIANAAIADHNAAKPLFFNGSQVENAPGIIH